MSFHRSYSGKVFPLCEFFACAFLEVQLWYLNNGIKCTCVSCPLRAWACDASEFVQFSSTCYKVNTWNLISALFIGPRSPWSDLCVRMSITNKQTTTPFVDLTDVTLADEDTNSILTDNVNRAIEGNVAMQVLLVANFGSNASGVSWWPNFEPMQVALSSGQIRNQFKWSQIWLTFFAQICN